MRLDRPLRRRARLIRPKRTYAAGLAQPRLSGRTRPRQHTLIGVALLLVAATLVPTHLAEHAGTLDVLPRNLEDLFLGFPMAGVLGLAGFGALIWR